MLSCYLAAFNHPKPKHALSHLLARFRIGKHLAPSWRVAKWHAGVMTDIMWHVLRKWWHSDSVFGFGENIIRIPSIPVFPSCFTKSPLTPIAMGFSLFLPTSFVPKWDEPQISRPPKFLVGVMLVSFVSFCVLLVLQLKSTFSNSLSTTVKRSWIWQLECVPLTLHVLHLLKIKLVRCLAADWTNTTYWRVFSQICIQCPHFSPFVVTMTLLVCVRRPSNDSATKCSEALEPFVWAEEDAILIAFLWGQCHGGGYFVNQGIGTLWWICYILAN